MHIPDGFLAPPVWVALDVAAIPAVGLLARRAQRGFEESRVPLLGVMGAFVFAAQMINFPVGVGTSGHLIGSALLAYTLGPAAAAIVMTAILAIQALVFQDGGILVLGANVLNMAVIGVWTAWLPYRALGRGRSRTLAIFAGAALSVMIGAALAVAELLLSGVSIPRPVAAISAGLFLVSALLEGAITVAVVRAIEAMNPKLILAPGEGRGVLAALALAALLLAVVGVLFASGSPDGLESLAESIGISDRAQVLLPTPVADYEASFFQNEWLRKAAAGLAGLSIVFAVCVLFGRLMARRGNA